MIRLDTTNRSLVLTLDGTVTTSQMSIVASYSDNNGSTYVGASNIALSNNTTQTTVVGAPGASTTRDIDSVIICNLDTVQQGLNVYLKDTSTLYQLVNTVLQPNDSLVYSHGQSWKTIDINGSTKTSIVSQVATNLIGTPALPDGVTCTTQNPGNNTGKLANTQFVTSALSAYSHAHASGNSVTVNLGSWPIKGGHFTITGTGFSAGVPVMIMQAATRPGSALYDSIEMDQIMVSAIGINSTTLQCNWGSTTKVANQYTFNYWI